MSFVTASLQYKQCTQAAATTVRTGVTNFAGFTCNSSSTGTIDVYDGIDTGGTKIYSGSLTAGQSLHFGGPSIRCQTGLHVVVGGTATVNVLFI